MWGEGEREGRERGCWIGLGNTWEPSPAYRNNGANDEGVVVMKDYVVGALEAYPKLRAAVLLCILQCATRKQKTSKKVLSLL